MARRRRSRLPLFAAAFVLLAAAAWLVGGWYASGPLEKQLEFDVGEGEGLSLLADDLQAQGAIGSATLFKLRAKLLGGGTEIKADRKSVV